MSRSSRTTPICGFTTAESEKADKRIANRRLRRRVRRAIMVEAEVMPDAREVSNPWLMDKDGKQWFDPDEHPRLMRK